jgi:hypothetical protein
LPAGLCSFPGYLSFDPACEGVPAMTHAVLLGDVRGRAAEALVAAWVGKLSPGYPLVLASAELPLDREEHGDREGHWIAPPGGLLADLPLRPRASPVSLRVVAGLFASEDTARRYVAEVLGGAGTVHAIAGPPRTYPGTGDHQAFERSRGVAVAIAHPAAAYADAAIARAEVMVGAHPRGEDEDTAWGRALAQATPACSVHAGQVFESDRAALYEHRRRFAPVTCEDGRRAWVAWAATRLESVVRVEREGPVIYQVVDVMCDTASIDRTPFVWGAPLRAGPRPRAACARGRS